MTKLCRKCDKTKNLDEFSWRSKAKQTKQSWCKECHKAIDKDRYYNGPRKKQCRERTVGVRKELREFVGQYKRNKGCSKCGYNRFAAALDFHHNSGDKDHTISRMVLNCFVKEKILQEMAKCSVLCARCHREIHATENGDVE